MVFLNPKIPTSQNYYNIKFNDHNLDWKSIYLLPRKVTLDSHTRIFQYKILNNILYLNEKLFKFRISSSSLCSFCNTSEETPEHLLSLCTHTLTLWSQLQVFLDGYIVLPDLVPQTAILGYLNIDNDFILINHLLLIFKQYLYKSRLESKVSFVSVLSNIKKIKQRECTIAEINPTRPNFIRKKWRKLAPRIDKP